MIDVLKRNKLLIILLGLSIMTIIVAMIMIFSGKNATKVPLRGVFVNSNHILLGEQGEVGV